MFVSFFIKIIYRRFLKKIFPKRFSQRCVFEPSCSEYALIAFEKYGLFEALRKTKSRLKRCDGKLISFGTIDKP